MRAEKQFLVDEVAAQLASSNYLLLANFTGVTVENATSVRNQLRAHGAEYHVVKNSILNIAAKQAKLPDISGHLSGHTALVTGGNNPTGVAKILVTFFKDFSKLEVKGGVVTKLDHVPGMVEAAVWGDIHEIQMDETVRSAWRRALSEAHPDRALSRGLPAEFVELAHLKSAAINEAYDTVMRERRALVEA
jgi:ribosomal protein L10